MLVASALRLLSFFKTSPSYLSAKPIWPIRPVGSKPGDYETNCPVIHLQSGDFVEANLEGYRPRLA